jgi:hypothetical protein
MKRILFLLLLTLSTVTGFSQVVINSYTYTVDNNEYYIIPSSFTGANEFSTSSLWHEGSSQVSTDYNFDTTPNAITGTTAYVDLEAGVNGSGTEGSPYNSLTSAVATSANIFYIKGKGKNANSKVTASKNIKLLNWPGFTPELTTQTDTDLVWSQNGTQPTVYDATWASASGFINTVMDRALTDENGNYRGYDAKGSLANVAAQAGSFWYESAANTLHVRTYDGRVPDSNIIGLIGSGSLLAHSATLSADRYIYAEGVSFYGGSIAINLVNTGASNLYYGFYNCKFGYSGGTEATVYVPARSIGYFRNCSSFYGRNDAMDYNGPSGSFAFEWYCSGGKNTWTGTATNGSTSHNAHKVIRVGCNYQSTSGKCIQDIENSYSFNVRCTAGNSLAANPNDYPYATNSIAATTTNMWLIECTRLNTKGYINFANSVLNVYDGTVGNITTATNSNSGTLNTLNTSQVYQ